MLTVCARAIMSNWESHASTIVTADGLEELPREVSMVVAPFLNAVPLVLVQVIANVPEVVQSLLISPFVIVPAPENFVRLPLAGEPVVVTPLAPDVATVTNGPVPFVTVMPVPAMTERSPGLDICCAEDELSTSTISAPANQIRFFMLSVLRNDDVRRGCRVHRNGFRRNEACVFTIGATRRDRDGVPARVICRAREVDIDVFGRTEPLLRRRAGILNQEPMPRGVRCHQRLRCAARSERQ